VVRCDLMTRIRLRTLHASARACARYGVLVNGEEMKGSRVKPLGIGQEIEVGLMGDNPRLDPIHRDGFPLAARKALHRRRCASAILARPAVVFGPVDSPILSFPLHSLRPHNARTRARGGLSEPRAIRGLKRPHGDLPSSPCFGAFLFIWRARDGMKKKPRRCKAG
jgi:hypothetical protein